MEDAGRFWFRPGVVNGLRPRVDWVDALITANHSKTFTATNANTVTKRPPTTTLAASTSPGYSAHAATTVALVRPGIEPEGNLADYVGGLDDEWLGRGGG